ncbi:unnamed protein product, partial [Cladocopium goreaui]
MNRACIKLHNEVFGGCCFTNICNMVTHTKVFKKKEDHWAPANLKLAQKAWCATHKKMCEISFTKDDVPLVGAPCILFSQYGLGEGFQNEVKSRCQKASIKFQQKALVSLHENVPAYDEAGPQDVRAPQQSVECDRKRRLMSGEEQLAALGYPCLQELASAAK